MHRECELARGAFAKRKYRIYYLLNVLVLLSIVPPSDRQSCSVAKGKGEQRRVYCFTGDRTKTKSWAKVRGLKNNGPLKGTLRSLAQLPIPRGG